MFSKEDILKFIEAIDEQLAKNKEVIDAHSGREVPSNSDILTLCELSKCLLIARKNWTDMLLYEYGVYLLGGVY